MGQFTGPPPLIDGWQCLYCSPFGISTSYIVSYHLLLFSGVFPCAKRVNWVYSEYDLVCATPRTHHAFLMMLAPASPNLVEGSVVEFGSYSVPYILHVSKQFQFDVWVLPQTKKR